MCRVVVGDLNLEELLAGIRSADQAQRLKCLVEFRKLLSLQNNQNNHIQQVIDCGACPDFIEFLHDADPVVQFEAAWALTNVASGTSAHTQYMMDQGAIPAFLELLSTGSTKELREQATWGLGNIAGDGPQSRDAVLSQEALPLLLTLLAEEDAPISMLRNGMWCVSRP